MEPTTEIYLEFIAGGYHFMMPLQRIRDIQGFESMDADLPVLDWNGLLGRTAAEEKAAYLIILTYNGTVFGVTASQVIGLCEIGQEAMLELKKPVRSGKNLFLKAAVVHEDAMSRTAFEAEGNNRRGRLAFILDPAVLSEYIYQDAG